MLYMFLNEYQKSFSEKFEMLGCIIDAFEGWTQSIQFEDILGLITSHFFAYGLEATRLATFPTIYFIPVPNHLT